MFPDLSVWMQKSCRAAVADNRTRVMGGLPMSITFRTNMAALTAQRSMFNATQNNLATRRIAYQEAETRIRDVNIAEEAAELVKNQILQQTSAEVIQLAKLVPELILRLLNPGYPGCQETCRPEGS